MDDSATALRRQTTAGALAVGGALAVQYLGASFAKHLFAVVGPAGVTTLRTVLAAALLLLLLRPSRRPRGRKALIDIACYGAMLGLMNLLIYQAFARIPLGIAVAIEVLGPLAVVLAGARRWLDLVWLAAALIGLGLLLPLRASAEPLDPVGLLCAAGAAATWALYIVFGKRVSASGTDVVFWGMLVAAVVTLPPGVIEAGRSLLLPSVILTGLAVAALSSALPYTLEMYALRRLPAHVFGVMVSASPAVAALIGFLVLGERLQVIQWLAIALIVFAVAGSTLAAAGGGGGGGGGNESARDGRGRPGFSPQRRGHE